MMKQLLITAVTILLTIRVNAQAGMPNALTCTEKAFNFSFNIATKWKFSAPKMGPAEAASYGTGYIPALSLKVNDRTPEIHSSYLFELPLNAETQLYATKQQNYTPLYYYNNFKVTDTLKHLSPGFNFFNSTINYSLLKPGFVVN